MSQFFLNGSGSGPVEEGILTLSAEGGPATQPDGDGNFDFSGLEVASVPLNAIEFSIPADGAMKAQVQVDNLTIQINSSNQLEVIDQLSGIGQTINNNTADLITFPMEASATVYRFVFYVAGRATTGEAVGFTVFCTAKTNGTTATIVQDPFVYDAVDDVLTAGSITVVASGNSAILRVTGVNTYTINYFATGSFTFI